MNEGEGRVRARKGEKMKSRGVVNIATPSNHKKRDDQTTIGSYQQLIPLPVLCPYTPWLISTYRSFAHKGQFLRHVTPVIQHISWLAVKRDGVSDHMRDEVDVLLTKESDLLHLFVERLVDELVEHGFGEGVEGAGFEEAGAALEVIPVGLFGVEFDL